MKMKVGISIMYLLTMLGLIIGWVMNIVALVQCDFAAPWKEEALRIIGLIVAPLGGVFGWFNF